jgi:tetratricopeptide (TPR) repeat protein
MEVPSRRGIFILGCLERRVTLYSQQVRALNLAFSLSQENRLAQGDKVLVVGGGAAGLTFAAGAAHLGAKVTLLERRGDLLSMFRGNHTRWLHPHIYEWPRLGSEQAHAMLPLLDWSADSADKVARELLSQWSKLKEEFGIHVFSGAKNIKPVPGEQEDHAFTWNAPGFGGDSFSTVVFAVGFGEEKQFPGVATPSYWEDDSLHQQVSPSARRVLVSGIGDGGVVDLLRLRLRDFRHEALVQELLADSELEPVKTALLRIEEDLYQRSLTPKALYDRYADLQVPDTLDQCLRKRLRDDPRVVLNSPQPYPLSAEASILNRFLLSRLLLVDALEYRQGRIEKVQLQQEGGPYRVRFDTNEQEDFDRVIIRHGAHSALERDFPWLWKEVSGHLSSINTLDQSRYPIWDDRVFSRKQPPVAANQPLLGRTIRLPRRGRIFGREELEKRLVERLLDEKPLPTAVLGPPGVGKSTLTVSALNAREVEQRYGPHRYFVHLDGVSTAARLNSEITQALGLPPGPDLPGRMAALFGDKPALLVLDNAETPLEADHQATEALLSDIASIPRLALLLSIRGRVQPSLPRMGTPIEVPVLEPDAARELFQNIAWNVDSHDSRVTELLEAQQGLALAVTLLAHVAQGVDLDWTYRQWQRMRGKLLERPGNQSRYESLAVSFELSLQSPLVSATASQLLSILSKLPAGVAAEDLEHLFPEDLKAPGVLAQAGLAFFENRRLRMLAPLREYMQAAHPPTLEDWARATKHYSKLAWEQGPLVGTANGAKALARLAEEVPNMDVVILDGLESTVPQAAIATVLNLNNFMRFSGYGTAETVKKARERARHLGDLNTVAQCLYTEGQLRLRRSEHARARELSEQALPLFEQLVEPHGQARCLQTLGSIALDEQELEKAQTSFERAMPLRQQLGDYQGFGNCLHGLGKVALARKQLGEARGHFKEALRLFEELQNDLGRAHCLRSLGELDADVRQLEEAQGLFEKVGDLRGMGHCLRGRADSALRSGHVQDADALYRQALRLLQQVGSVRGVANCLLGVGYLERKRGNDAAARRAFEQALEKYRHVRDKAHEDECRQQLAGHAPTSARG